MFARVCRSSPTFRAAYTRTMIPAFSHRFLCTQAEPKAKIDSTNVPHPHDFTDGDPMPHIREGLSKGPPQYGEDTSPEIEKLAQDVVALNMVEMVQVNYLICKKLGIDPDILSIIKGALSSGGGSGPAKEEAAPEVVDSGFRKVLVREIPAGVKDRFAIMKLMRAVDEGLSLADVGGMEWIYGNGIRMLMGMGGNVV